MLLNHSSEPTNSLSFLRASRLFVIASTRELSSVILFVNSSLCESCSFANMLAFLLSIKVCASASELKWFSVPESPPNGHFPFSA
jgi:hypothetical protein